MSAVQATSQRGRGAYPTPPELVHRVVGAAMPAVRPGQRVTVLDPACGDGRFLAAAADHVMRCGGTPVLHGVDLDPDVVADARGALTGLDSRLECADALALDWCDATYDVVLGNPPFLSQLAAATTRGRASAYGGGPYADAAAEFLALALDRCRPGGGRIGLVLPQSILGSRDAGAVRTAVEAEATLIWSWWSPHRHFDSAAVFVCALAFERRSAPGSGNRPAVGGDRHPVWTDVVLRSIGVPDVPAALVDGTIGDRCLVTANFRDEYYGLIPAVGDHHVGPQLITSGLIDPNRCLWGSRPVTFNRQRFLEPRVDVSNLDERMQRWATRLAVPKVLIANQTRIVECVVDADGSMLPGVPVVTARLHEADPDVLVAVACVLSAPFTAAWLWNEAAGTGLSARTIRLRPGLVAAVPWPAGSLDSAVVAWRAGDLTASAAAVHRAYGIDGSTHAELLDWWESWGNRWP